MFSIHGFLKLSIRSLWNPTPFFLSYITSSPGTIPSLCGDPIRLLTFIQKKNKKSDKNVLMFEHYPKQSTSKTTHRHTHKFCEWRIGTQFARRGSSFFIGIAMLCGLSTDLGYSRYHWCLQQHLKHNLQGGEPWVCANYKWHKWCVGVVVRAELFLAVVKEYRRCVWFWL